LAQKIDPFVQKNFRWNFSVNLIDISFITLAFTLISRETIMPLLVTTLTDSPIVIGLIPAIHSVSYYLPQLFAANHAESMKRKLPFVMFVGGIMERVPYFLIGVAILLWAQSSPTMTLILLFLAIGTASMGAGIATPAWFTMIGKVLPVNRRGVFFGVSEGLGALIGIGGAVLVGVVLDSVSYPMNFAILFLVASVFMAISWVGLALNREPESPIVKKQIPIRHYFQQLPAILRNHHNFRHFLISYSISRLGMMAVGFFIVFGNNNFDLTGADVGTLTAVLIGSQAVMQVSLGWMADKRGHKFNLTISAFAMAFAAVLAILATSFLTLVPAFMLLGTAIASDNISKFNIVLEFAVPEDQPTFIGLTNTLLAPVTFIGPIIGGLIVTTLSYHEMFVVAMFCAVIGGLLLMFWVQEPRRTQPQPIAANSIE
jgi:MFS family permease